MKQRSLSKVWDNLARIFSAYIRIYCHTKKRYVELTHEAAMIDIDRRRCSFQLYYIPLQPELVEFYYLWKKTPGANNNRPHRRRRPSSLRRNRVTRASNTPNNKKEETPEPTATEDNSSLTEDDASECDSDSSITNKRTIILIRILEFYRNINQ